MVTAASENHLNTGAKYQSQGPTIGHSHRRFFPRWQMVRKGTFRAESTSGNDPRRGTAALNLACIDGEPELRQLQ